LELDQVTILIIEDEHYVRTIIRRILATLQVGGVHEAKDGGDGLMQTLRLRPSLVLCDIHMEPVGGVKYLETLRDVKIPEIAATPVIFLTSDSNQDLVLRARALKVSGYMVKPVSVNDMKKSLGRVLDIDFPKEF
jgi:two-component system, chemotaxis family, chemotaxis protein CheY